MTEILNELLSLQDLKYKKFSETLIPNIDPDRIIGVRTPAIRAIAKRMLRDGTYREYLDVLPHEYNDEYILHSILIAGIKDPAEALARVEAYLPYFDNWATCDVCTPKCFKKIRPELRKRINAWIETGEPYRIRYAVLMLMDHFLDEDFDPEGLAQVAAIRSDEYYVNMMKAWYFATAMAKQWDAAVKYIEERKLDRWSHNKAIQKSIESFRVSDEHKDYLRPLRIKR